MSLQAVQDISSEQQKKKKKRETSTKQLPAEKNEPSIMISDGSVWQFFFLFCRSLTKERLRTGRPDWRMWHFQESRTSEKSQKSLKSSCSSLRLAHRRSAGIGCQLQAPLDKNHCGSVAVEPRRRRAERRGGLKWPTSKEQYVISLLVSVEQINRLCRISLLPRVSLMSNKKKNLAARFRSTLFQLQAS